LIDAVTGTHLWADRFDGSLEDLFELQDKIALSVAGIIEPTLQAAEIRRSSERPTSDVTAYDLYLRAYAMVVSRRDESVKRCGFSMRPSNAIQITVRRLPGPLYAAFCFAMTARAKI